MLIWRFYLLSCLCCAFLPKVTLLLTIGAYPDVLRSANIQEFYPQSHYHRHRTIFYSWNENIQNITTKLSKSFFKTTYFNGHSVSVSVSLHSSSMLPFKACICFKTGWTRGFKAFETAGTSWKTLSECKLQSDRLSMLLVLPDNSFWQDANNVLDTTVDSVSVSV